MKHFTRIITTVLLGAAVIAMAGCNIFEFASDAEKSPEEKAQDLIRDGKYAAAREELADAVKDSTSSEALYYNAKAILLESGIDIFAIIDMIEGQDDVKSGDNLGILTFINDLTPAEQTIWYRSNVAVMTNLRKIWKGSSTGIISSDDVALDFTASTLLAAVLGLKDTNRDNTIDSRDFSLDLSFISDANPSVGDGFAIGGGSYTDAAGIDIPFEGLEVFLGAWGAAKPTATGAAVGMEGYTPDDINPLIAYYLSVMDEGADAVLSLLTNMGITSFDADEIADYLDQAAMFINYYWYNDGIDNDGDGRVDEETINGIDDDNDGLTDEDSDYHPAGLTESDVIQYQAIWQKWQNR